MTKIGTVALAMLVAGVASAQIKVSIGVRETGFAGGSFSSIGGNGGSTGGIEWVNRDAQTLILDGTWQLFTFNLTTDPITAFAGTSANGILEGAFGVLEHIRFLNDAGITQPYRIWVDDIANTVTPVGAPPVTTTFGTFEGYADGTEAIFQEPNFSGSTSANLVAGGTSRTTSLVAHSGAASDRLDFQFVDGTPTRWLRLTTFNTPNQPNPLIRFDESAQVTFWLKGVVPEPASILGIGVAAAFFVRRRKRA